jgi:hypothetical protein
MIILDSTSQTVKVTTTLTKNINYYVAYSDHTTTALTPGQSAGAIATATTTTIVSAPGASTQRQVHYITIVNKDSTAQSLTVYHDNGGTFTVLGPSLVTIQPGESLEFSKEGFVVKTIDGAVKTSTVYNDGIEGYPVNYYKVGTASEAIGVWYSHSKDTGFPGAWATGTPGINGRVTDGTTAADNGCLIIKTPASGNNYLKSYVVSSTVAHNHWLFDVLWVNTGITVTTTTAQAITTPTFPARDLEGTTNGLGFMVGILVTTATTNAGAITNTTLSYTNSDGTAGRTATIASFPATAVAGTVVWFQLAAGDKGVRSIQSVTLGTSYGGGAISLIVAIPVANGGAATANLPSYGSMLSVDTTGVKLYSGVCILPFYISSATTATTTSGLAVIENR